MNSALAFVLAFLIASVATPLVRRLAVRWKVLDFPRMPRKIHTKPTPLLGGLGVFVAVAVGTLCAVVLIPQVILGGVISPKHLIGMLLGACILMVGGFLDDKYSLPPWRQILFPLAAAIVVVASGIGIKSITNPFGGVIPLDSAQFTLFSLGGVPYQLTFPADLFTVLWLMTLMYTTKFLDGLDGLVSGIAVIGAAVLVGLSLTALVNQPETAVLAALTAGAFAGFLPWNWHPAKIFLGESGSIFAGYLLGILAIISGGKIATTLLVLGLPLLDAAWVVSRRVFVEKRSPFSPGDKLHLHFRLMDSGLSARHTVLIIWSISLAFGGIALFLKTQAKAIAFVLLVALMCVLIYVLSRPRDRGNAPTL